MNVRICSKTSPTPTVTLRLSQTKRQKEKKNKNKKEYVSGSCAVKDVPVQYIVLRGRWHQTWPTATTCYPDQQRSVCVWLAFLVKLFHKENGLSVILCVWVHVNTYFCLILISWLCSDFRVQPNRKWPFNTCSSITPWQNTQYKT